MRPRILVFCEYYLPGYRSGGGMWTVVNLVEHFHDEYEFFIVAKNFDSSDPTPYKDQQTSAWNRVGNAQVYYFDKGELSAERAGELVREIRPTAVFLNSAFSMPVLKFLSARQKKLFEPMPVVLAPCGEMSKASLSIKPLKKRLFLAYARLRGLYKDLIWKASFPADADDIREVFGKDVEVLDAPDLLPRSILPEFSSSWKPVKKAGSVKLVLLSRISPMKNVTYLLERLGEIGEGDIQLDLIGPIDDDAYWEKCSAMIKRLPANVRVNAVGAHPNHEALKLVAACHFFIMPTLNENFGYVLIEAMAAGCPLIISDRTAWTDIDEKNVGWQIPLDRPEAYVGRLRACIAMENEEYARMSANARKYAEDWLKRPELKEATSKVLRRALSLAR